MEDNIIYHEIIGCRPFPAAVRSHDTYTRVHINSEVQSTKEPRPIEIMDVNIAIELFKYSRCLYVLTGWGRSGNERLGPDGKNKLLLQLPIEGAFGDHPTSMIGGERCTTSGNENTTEYSLGRLMSCTWDSPLSTPPASKVSVLESALF